MKILTTINWKEDKIVEYTKPKSKRSKKKFDYVFNIASFYKKEGCDLINFKYITELFAPYLTNNNLPLIVQVHDSCEYNFQHPDPIKEYRINYKIIINENLIYKFNEYFIYQFLPVKGVILQKETNTNGNKTNENLLSSMWNDGVTEVNGSDLILGFKTRTSLEFKSAQSLSICKKCCHYEHHSFGWLKSNDIFCKVHPARTNYNLVECPSFNIPNAQRQTPICYNCKYYNLEHSYHPRSIIGCAVHPEHKKYDLLECRDFELLVED